MTGVAVHVESSAGPFPMATQSELPKANLAGVTANNAAAAILASANDISSWQEDFYRDLHQHPELSHQELRTSAAVAEQLGTAGYQVTTGVGGTGVVGILRNGDGPTVLLRADMDALPVKEDTGLPYASVEVATPVGADVATPVMHACGHDVHTACLTGAARLLADGRKHWRGTVIALFQPAEETMDGARGMVADGLASLTGKVDVVLGQHVIALPAGRLATIPGPALAGGASIRVTVFGRGGHASMPQNTIDPVLLAAFIVVRLQSIIAREVDPSEPAVLTVGSLQAGTKANIIPDHAELLLNIRYHSDAVRSLMLNSIRRIVTAECAAAGSPREPEFDIYENAPLTDNDPAVTRRVTEAFTSTLGDDVMMAAPPLNGSEDFSDIARAVNAPYSYWLLGGTDPEMYRKAEAAGTVAADIPVNHSPFFAPVIEPTLRTGTAALVTAALSWLGI